MTNMGIVARATPGASISSVRRNVNVKLTNRPNLAEPWVYVQTGDPDFDTGRSPEWLNDFFYLEPVAFRHGLDGQTDMIGVYDLTAAVSGTIAFMMPNEWALQAPALHAFVMLLDDPGAIEDRVFGMAAQVIDPNDPDAVAGETPVRIYWPLWGQAL